ncbi:SRPBCC family protein [Paenibacillus arenilitoris]|uniref:SRPBCC family protein n=1 Tax=Paenibacillus arenilitoris TaxID=2772299 RepID=A0A927H5U8_9BACL|nr:SRPBCC family protein [Paenibacillus arenilitoris]MBD2869315.1 SRPBCC family protein [Paenibacillus arenilitoris]
MHPDNTMTAVVDRELIVSRTFHAPRELVFDTWTNPGHLPKWWGPNGFTITVRAIDVRPGGVWRYVMHGPDGTDYDNKISYHEVVRPERLVYSHGDGEDDEHFRVTVTFAEQGNGTTLTMRSLFKSAEELETAVNRYGAIEGAKQTFDRFAEQLATLA